MLSLSIPRILNARMITLAILALVFASTAYGFAASNTVPTGNAGDGANAISGYSVSNVKYNLNNANPGNIDSVAFDVAGAVKPSTVKAKLVTGGAFYSCDTASANAPYRFSCLTTAPQVTTAAADELRVVAVD